MAASIKKSPLPCGSHQPDRCCFVSVMVLSLHEVTTLLGGSTSAPGHCINRRRAPLHRAHRRSLGRLPICGLPRRRLALGWPKSLRHYWPQRAAPGVRPHQPSANQLTSGRVQTAENRCGSVMRTCYLRRYAISQGATVRRPSTATHKLCVEPMSG